MVTPKKQQCGVTLKCSQKIKYNDFIRSAIRRKVLDLFRGNILPTVDALLNVVNEDHVLPNFKRTTSHSLLKEIGFHYEKRGRRNVCVCFVDLL